MPSYKPLIRAAVISLAVGALVVSCASPGRVAERRAVREGVRNEAMEPLLAAGERVMRAAAPFDSVAPGAYAAAVAAARGKSKFGPAWVPIGASPLWANNPDYAGTDPIFSGPSRLGWVKLSGRVNALAVDPSNGNRVFLGAAAGGLWETKDGGGSWQSIGDTLPTQAMGAVAFSPANGGTILAGTGDNAIGGVVTPSGLGIYTSSNDGGSWTKASGIPDGLVTFKITVDPRHPMVDYVATNKGLYRSADGGLSYVNVALPVPKVLGGVATLSGCAGNTTDAACTYASVVTDVIVQPGGAVMAAVGYPLGARVTRYGITQAPQNGIYLSASGLAGSFTFVDPGSSTAPTLNGFTPTPYVGRTTLAGAFGPGQDTNTVYALVQDAKKLQNCVDSNALPAACTGTGEEALVQATYLDGAYVSRDFGRTWTRILSAEQLRAPGTGSALELGILGVGPGIQAWYNNWIAVDPTATDALTHAPTRVVFGLEEIWENAIAAPVLAPTNWKVIGRYWNACALIIAGVQCSDTSPVIPGTTTHPDQHAGLFVPDGLGGVTLFAGNDGGAYAQHVTPGGDFSSSGWAYGISDGLHTLQPYDARAAKDGTVVFGAQDNGTVKITPLGRQDMIFGGDGFFTGIDPDNSSRIVQEYVNGSVSGSTDGGRSWTSYDPLLTSPLFSTPFEIDPGNADHMMIAGRNIAQTPYPYQIHCIDSTLTPSQCSDLGFVVQTGIQYDNWTTVFDLGTVPTTALEGVVAQTVDRQTSALDLLGDAAYVGFCGPCSVFSGLDGFESGIATNVSGAQPPAFGQSSGWHLAGAAGLPQRYVTSVRIDPSDPTRRRIYVTLGGFSSHWVPPGANGEDTSRIGTGHVFASQDAGETFVDVSGDLPDAPADWVLLRRGRLIVGTDVGVFISTDTSGGTYSRLGDLPTVPVLTIRQDPGNANHIIAATFGRGVYGFTFPGQ